ncbi:hypothetical protein ACO1O0_000159 [Amphichorda felina]
MDPNLFGGGFADPYNQDQPQSSLDMPPFQAFFGGSGDPSTSIGQEDTMSGAMPTTSSVVTTQPTMSGALQETTTPSHTIENAQEESGLAAHYETREPSRSISPPILGGTETIQEEGAEQSKVGSGPSPSPVRETSVALGVDETVISDSIPDLSGIDDQGPSYVHEEQDLHEEWGAVDGMDKEEDIRVEGDVSGVDAEIEHPRAASVVLGDEKLAYREELEPTTGAGFGPASPPESPKSPTPEEAAREISLTPEPADLPARLARSVPPKGKTASPAPGSAAKRRRRTAADMLAAATSSFIKGDYSDRSKRHVSPRAISAAATPVKTSSARKATTVTPKSAAAQTPKTRGRPRKSDTTTKTPKSAAKKTLSTAETPATTPKRRGRPPKNASSATATPVSTKTPKSAAKKILPTAETPATTPKRRGRPPKDASSADATPGATKATTPKRGRTAAKRASPLKHTHTGRAAAAPAAATKTTAKATSAVVAEPPKRRGRPPKAPATTEEPKSTRGRPRKAATETTSTDARSSRATRGSTQTDDVPSASSAKALGRKAKAAEAPAAADPPKRRGRPPKAATSTTATAAPAKKRGRAEEETPVESKRGRTGRLTATEADTRPATTTVKRGGRPAKKAEPLASEDVKETKTRGRPKTTVQTEAKPEPARAATSTRGGRGRGRAGKGDVAAPGEQTTRASLAKVQTGRVTKTKATPKATGRAAKATAPAAGAARRSVRSRG